MAAVFAVVMTTKILGLWQMSPGANLPSPPHPYTNTGLITPEAPSPFLFLPAPRISLSLLSQFLRRNYFKQTEPWVAEWTLTRTALSFPYHLNQESRHLRWDLKVCAEAWETRGERDSVKLGEVFCGANVLWRDEKPAAGFLLWVQTQGSVWRGTVWKECWRGRGPCLLPEGAFIFPGWVYPHSLPIL